MIKNKKEKTNLEYDALFFCKIFNLLMSTIDNNTTTNNTNTFFCDCCNDTLSNSLATESTIENDEQICQDCLDANYRYSERREYYVHNENWEHRDHDWEDDEVPEDSDSNVLSYTARVSTRRRKKDYEKLTNDLLFLGIS